MIKHKVASALEIASKHLKKYVIFIGIEIFVENLDLIQLFKKEISELKKYSRSGYVNLHCDEPEVEFEWDTKLSKLLFVKEFKHTTLLNMKFIAGYKLVKKFEEEKFMDRFKQILENHNIAGDLSYDLRIIEKYDKIRTHFTGVMNLDKKIKPLKTRIKNTLWLKYGVDDKLSEKEIDKIVNTINKVKIETFWVNKNNEVLKIKNRK